MQATSHLLMIRPAAFGFNEQTAASNAFQKQSADAQAVQQAALQEFDIMVDNLREHSVDVTVINDTEEPVKPDAIFPNNWVSFQANGDVMLYPMQAENRRLERREDIFRILEDKFTIRHTLDLSRFELQSKYLEGTGSMVLDRDNKIAYACLSPRTDNDVLTEFCKYESYRPVVFRAVDARRQAIYHTNVLMCIGTRFAVICLDSIADAGERGMVINAITNTGKELVEISLAQLQAFAGNMLEVKNNLGEYLLIMSEQAYQSLNAEQITILKAHANIVYSNLKTIETHGGGSARCMMAEIHLPLL